MTESEYQERLQQQALALEVPLPTADEQAHSYQLYRHLYSQLQQAPKSSITLTDFIQQLLYAPGLGYYTGGRLPFGEGGDFETAPEISDAFAKAILHALEPCFLEGLNHIVELGAGRGTLAKQLLAADGSGAIQRYEILEVSTTLRQAQQEHLAELPSEQREGVNWLTRLPDKLNAIIIGNELLDAIPCHFFKWSGEQLLEPLVTLDEEAMFTLEWTSTVSQPVKDWLSEHGEKITWQTDYVYEIAPARAAYMRYLADHLDRGAVVLTDYGYGANEFFLPERRSGTAAAFYKHHTHNDLLALPGLQDITSHVNFSEITLAAEHAGLQLCGFSNQMELIMPVLSSLTTMATSDRQRFEQSQQLQKLLMPGQMGELVKVIAFAKNIGQNALPRVSSRLIDRL